MITKELKAFAEERGLKVRYLKRVYSDIIYREGNKLSIDVDAYDRLMPDRSASSNRKKPSFSDKTQLKRVIGKVDRFDHFITASGQELEFLQERKEHETDLHKIALLQLEIDELNAAIAEKELLKRRAEMEIKRLMPPGIDNQSENPEDSEER